jgi:S1-C subfamily serine protease
MKYEDYYEPDQPYIHFQDALTPKEKKGQRHGLKIISILLILLLSAAAGFGGGLAALYYGQNLLPTTGGNSPIQITVSDSLNTAEAIAEKVIPSVVVISTTSRITYQSWFGTQQGITQGSGTRIIVDEQGYILTNSHVVGDGKAEEIIVQLYDGREVKGSVLWNDRSIDLAIVKIQATGLTAAELGDSEEVRIGSYAVAIGNPLGMAFDRSVTQGIISGLDRTITVSDGQTQTTMEGLMQTDASINSGNSGGPLLNSRGQVIGINSAKAQTGEGLGFAIPINTAKPIIDEIKTKGEFNRSYLGIRGISVENFNQSYPENKLSAESGVFIVQIYMDSPAAKAGMKEQDIITKLDGKDVKTMTQLITGLYAHRPGDTIPITIIRDGKTLEISVTLEEMVETAE